MQTLPNVFPKIFLLIFCPVRESENGRCPARSKLHPHPAEGILKKIRPFKGRGMYAEERAAFGKTASACFASARYKFESPADAGLSNCSIGAEAPAAAFGKTASACFASARYKFEDA